MTVYRSFQEKLGGTEADTYIGRPGEIIVDPNDSSLRITDGVTPGGVEVSGGSGGSAAPGYLNTGDLTLTEDSEYVLTAAEANKIIYHSGDYSITFRVPASSEIPNGSVYTFLSETGNLYFYGVEYEGEGSGWEWGAIAKNGDLDYRSAWRGDNDYFVTLTKITDALWVISGQDVTDQD